jgi:hypothetical protein
VRAVAEQFGHSAKELGEAFKSVGFEVNDMGRALHGATCPPPDPKTRREEILESMRSKVYDTELGIVTSTSLAKPEDKVIYDLDCNGNPIYNPEATMKANKPKAVSKSKLQNGYADTYFSEEPKTFWEKIFGRRKRV